MKRLLFSIYAALLLGVLLTGCGKDEDLLPDQQKRIVSFLTSSHTPRLILFEDMEEDSQVPFYTVAGESAYRYIANYYDPERPARAEVGAASKVTFTFRAYVFNYSPISNSATPFYTNDPTFEKRFYDQLGLTPGAWSFEPLTLDMKDDHILKGLYHSLLGCHAEDDVEIYMTSNMAYDDQNFSIIPKNSPIALFLTIHQVE